MGEMVEFPSNGADATGYLAVPASGQGPGLVVIQEWWGLVPHIRNVVDRFAAEGYVALAPDLYHGAVASEPDEAGKVMMAMQLEGAARDLLGAVAFLKGHRATRGGDGRADAGVGVVGFCMGGGLALWLATLSTDIKLAVAYYGIIPWPEAQPEYSRITGRVLGHYGTRDGFASPAAVAELEEQLRAANVDTTMHMYPGEEHAFFNDDRPEVYGAEASRLSFERTLAALRETIGPR